MSDPQIDVEVDSGIDQIAISYDTALTQLTLENVDLVNQIALDVQSDIDSIDVNVDLGVDQITVENVDAPVQVIEVSTIFSAVSSVNGLTGDVVMTYIETLSYTSPVNGIYSYTITHNLGYENVIPVVYNIDNETVIVEHDAIDSNTIVIKSMSNMNNFKVVVQR